MIAPWVIGAAAALWFGFLGWKAQTNAALWAVWGAVLGLVITTFAVGLGQAADIPLSSADAKVLHAKEVGVAALLVFLLASAFTVHVFRRQR